MATSLIPISSETLNEDIYDQRLINVFCNFIYTVKCRFFCFNNFFSFFSFFSFFANLMNISSAYPPTHPPTHTHNLGNIQTHTHILHRSQNCKRRKQVPPKTSIFILFSDLIYRNIQANTYTNTNNHLI